jgi:Helix-turn-helix domain
MGTPKRRRSDRADALGCVRLGALRQDDVSTGVRFWRATATGVPSEEAALAAAVSPPAGTRWFREHGGMSPLNLEPLSRRYLSLADREEIAFLRTQRLGGREIARQFGRSPSTISRELRRNARHRPLPLIS